MSHGHTRIPTKGACIYCGARDVRLTDEHVVPLSLGGSHILEKASCDPCANITKKFEQDVARELWGHARISYGAPSRRRNKRPTHIVLSDPKNPMRKVKIPYSEYAPPMVFYKMQTAGMLAGLPADLDTSSAWKLVTITDDVKAKAFEQKFGIPMTCTFRHVPVSFARTLAKIGYCNTLTVLDPSDFEPICIPYILGQKANLSHIVGGELDTRAPDPGMGYVLKTRLEGKVGYGKMKIIADIRLYANNGTPDYHVVIGEVAGYDNTMRVLKKYKFPEEGSLVVGDGYPPPLDLLPFKFRTKIP